jgi:hypothetical protein
LIQRTLRQNGVNRGLGTSLDYTCSGQDRYGNIGDSLTDFLSGFLQGPVKLLVHFMQALTELATSF